MTAGIGSSLLARMTALTLLCSGCVSAPADPDHARGRLSARPRATQGPCPAGLRSLGLDPSRDTQIYVPDAVAAAAKPAPLVVYLHGAMGYPTRGLDRLRPSAEAAGFILLAPRSRGDTWDGISGGLGPDVAFIDRSLDAAFARCAVDPARVAVLGFSDGAGYALTLGIANGDLFTRAVAFSPCVVTRGIPRVGLPSLFISHGRADEILPIAGCGRPLAAALQRAGYSVEYEEFDGKHEFPPSILEAAFQFLQR